MKQTLVMLPGLLCDEALWQPQVDALARDCDPQVVDVTRDDSLEGMARRVLGEVKAPQFALAGLSMGGYVAFEIMRQAPQRVARLALLDTRARPDLPDETQRRLAFIELAQREGKAATVTSRLLPLLIHPSRVADEALVATIRAMSERVGLQGYLRQQKAIMARPDSRPALARIQCPTLVLCGRQDALTPLEMSEEMAAGIPGSRLAVIEDCGHLSTLERSGEVNAALREWLGSV